MISPKPCTIVLRVFSNPRPEARTEEQRTGDQRNEWIELCDDDQADHHDDRNDRQDDDHEERIRSINR
jgi:hypothetical protein